MMSVVPDDCKISTIQSVHAPLFQAKGGLGILSLIKSRKDFA